MIIFQSCLVELSIFLTLRSDWLSHIYCLHLGDNKTDLFIRTANAFSNTKSIMIGQCQNMS